MAAVLDQRADRELGLPERAPTAPPGLVAETCEAGGRGSATSGFAGLRDQSWWCGWGPSEKAELVVCALIENGGHGGTAAAPAALKVFEQYFQVEPGCYEAGILESD